MARVHAPFSLRKYEILTEGVTPDQVDTALRGMLSWMRDEQESFFASEGLSSLVEQLASTSAEGSLNSFARGLGLAPGNPHHYQAHNLSEMYRVEVMSKTAGYLQSELLVDVISTTKPGASPSEIIKSYKATNPGQKKPTWQFVVRTRERLEQKGTLHSRPSSTPRLPLSACDMYFAKAHRVDNTVFLSIKLHDGTTPLGPVTLAFKVPSKKNYANGKITRPTIRLDANDQVTFDFTVQDKAPVIMTTKRTMGVDLGIIEPFSATSMDATSYSAPIATDKRSRAVSDQIGVLVEHKKQLWRKIHACEESGHVEKAGLLRVEASRIRSKIARLKKVLAYAMANRIVEAALATESEIVLEDLSWVPNSTWAQAKQQEAIRVKAAKAGVPTRIKDPRGSSTKCAKCSSVVVQSGRMNNCPRCKKRLDRDISSGRRLGHTGLYVPLDEMVQRSLLTRAAKPAGARSLGTGGDSGTGKVTRSVFVRERRIRFVYHERST